jgi:3-oxoacyl-[acyl-carrier protein] reductase
VCVDLAAAGANVVFTFRNDESGACETVRAIVAVGRCGLALRADGTGRSAPAQAVATVMERFGRLDILVNNAGINRDGVVWKLTDEDWGLVIETDLAAAFRFTRATVPHMRANHGGRVVNISSINGLRGKFGQSS